MTRTFASAGEAAEAAALAAASLIRKALEARGKARVTAATGASQFEFLRRLIAQPDIDWKQVELFHLDEYIGLPATHPASFVRYIRERIVEPAGIVRVHYLDGLPDPVKTCRIAGEAIAIAPVDVAFVGIGENGHLAFNDPPADFETEEPFLIVNLDERSRRQQVGEGWFARLDQVPRRAITMSIRQILKARSILCLATGTRKAEAVKLCFEGGVRPEAPASALRLHPEAVVFLDREAASSM